MTLERDFHMVGGTGGSSYAANSTIQKKIASGAMFLVKEALESLVTAIPSSEMLLVFADLGCSTGANTFLMLPEVLRTISAACSKLGRPDPEIQLLLNDLPGNDFNALLGSVLSSHKEKTMNESMQDKYVPFYAAAVPGSFYDQLFSKRSVHFIYSCASIHWLSQFQKDFSSFLRHRSEELCPEGHMALIFTARTSVDPLIEECAVWMSWYDEALRELVSQGVVKAFDVDSFNIPMFLPSIEEVKSIIQNDGLFEIIQHDVYEMSYRDSLGDISNEDAVEIVQRSVMAARVVLGPLLVSHFGDSIIDPLFSVAPKIVAKYFWKEEYKSTSIAISLKKK